jgi:hypothetical protein
MQTARSAICCRTSTTTRPVGDDRASLHLGLLATHPNSLFAEEWVPATPNVEGSPNVFVWNNTGIDIVELYIVPWTETELGENLISVTMKSGEGYSFKSAFASDVCAFMSLAVSFDGQLFGRENQDFCSTTDSYILRR